MESRLQLTEFRTEFACQLSSSERDALRRLHPGIRLEPSVGLDGRYDITPDQRIGAVILPNRVIEIRPKVPMSSVLFMVSYACDAVDWLEHQPEYKNDRQLVEVLAIMLAHLVEHATRRGLLNGYRCDDETLQSPRGRVLFDEQIRRWQGASPPIEVRHDVFTSDIIENRILLAALLACGRMPHKSRSTTLELARAQRLLGAVSRVSYLPAAVPSVPITRLNRHYQSALVLARILLQSASLDLGAGGARGSAFLIDMNAVFETFVRASLRKALNVDESSFPSRPGRAVLDEAEVVPLRPDLCLMSERQTVWVGDAKYKRLPAGAYANADLYQMLAYSIALGLEGGTLIYAADEGVRAAEHVVVRSGKRLRVVALDLSAPPPKIIEQVNAIAAGISRPRRRGVMAEFGRGPAEQARLAPSASGAT